MDLSDQEWIEFPPIYCINVATSKERRQRMTRRFKYHGLIEAVKFVEAVPKNSSLLDYYIQGMYHPSNQDQWRATVSCYLSHLKAIRQFLEDTSEDGPSAAIICEDDLLLHNNFLGRFVEIMQNKPDDASLVTFCFMLEQKDEYFRFAGKHPDQKNLLHISPKYTWGTQMYYITRPYAKQVLTTYDKPLVLADQSPQTPEIFIQQSGGYAAYPPLAIEDTPDSDRAPQDLPYHRKHLEQWDYQNYQQSELNT